MAAGTPVVSTTLGAEGLAVMHGKDILIADTPEAMADAVVSMQAGSPVRQEIVANGRRLVQSNTTGTWWARSCCACTPSRWRWHAHKRSSNNIFRASS